MLYLPILFILFIINNAAIFGATSKCSPSDNIMICRDVSSTQELLSQISADQAQNLKIINNAETNFALTEYQGSISHFVESLDLSSVGRLILSDHGFKDFSLLRTLNASNIQLEDRIKTSWFGPASMLKDLDMSDNRLVLIEQTDLQNLPTLEKLDLSGNYIKTVQTNAFSHMGELKALNLGFNLLESIDIGTVSKLITLNLRDNLLETVPSNVFRKLPLLEELNLQSNNLKVIEDRAFAGLNRIKVLNLSQNRLTSIRKNTFAGMQRSRPNIIDLGENDINFIEPGSFEDLSKLQNLNLSRNSIGALDNNFAGLRGVRRLCLSNNDIARLADNVFEPLVSLEMLDLSGNSLQTVNRKMFGSSGDKLKKMFLSKNSITVLPEELFQTTPNIDYFSVSFNELTNLGPNLFEPMKNLKKLHMGHNYITDIPSRVANDLTSISELLIDHNKLTYFPQINTSYPYLKKVAIEGNPWQCACLDEILNFVTNRSIEYWRDAYYDGKKAVCVVTRVKVCVKDLAIVRREGIVDIFDDE